MVETCPSEIFSHTGASERAVLWWTFDKRVEKWGLQIAAISDYGFAAFPEMEGKLIFYRWVNNRVGVVGFCEIENRYCYLFAKGGGSRWHSGGRGAVPEEIALGDISEPPRLLKQDLSRWNIYDFLYRLNIQTRRVPLLILYTQTCTLEYFIYTLSFYLTYLRKLVA